MPTSPRSPPPSLPSPSSLASSVSSPASDEIKTAAAAPAAASRALLSPRLRAGDGTLEYAKELVGLLLEILKHQPCFRLATIRLVVDLLTELVFDAVSPRPCLVSRHALQLEAANLLASYDMHGWFSGDRSDAVMDVFDDELNGPPMEWRSRDLIS